MLLLDLSHPNNPFYVDFWAELNSEVDFLNFVKAAVLAGWLKYRDFFIINNTSIHYSQGTWAELLLVRHGITYLFLPTYSPELNPCKLIFLFIKTFLCHQWGVTDQIPHLIVHSLVSLTLAQVHAFYHHCVHIQSCIVT
jgi:hypothetical protein